MEFVPHERQQRLELQVCVCAQFQLLHDIMQPCVCLFLFMAVFSESVQVMHRGIYSVCFMVLQWEL